ncbi:hypothetical protein GMST_03620 [Geomonas silvestris]|uniref:Big-1 domain-containing protein n=1 Tax=Geomonas silvestris TaxID=2740184 RepID=A0A6V8MDJ2_9BACT|nr:hypothetical protein [Geomonas silvestris]GFO58037.1 hypothetical protein GMST_03620 [Geomonas silvestris]
MKLKNLLAPILLIASLFLSSCGGNGLNGSLALTTELQGSMINATATYTNPNTTNLIGVNISFSVLVGNTLYDLGAHPTNNSGQITLAIPLAGLVLNGTQSVTVMVKTGDLQNFSSLDVTGRTISLTPPSAPSTALTTLVNTALTVNLPSATAFAIVKDPIGNDVNGHILTITAHSDNPLDAVTLNANSTATDSDGKASFPGATIVFAAPTVAGSYNRVITWTVTDTTTNLSKTGVTAITFTAL